MNGMAGSVKVPCTMGIRPFAAEVTIVSHPTQLDIRTAFDV